MHYNPGETQAIAIAVPIYLSTTSSNEALHALKALGTLPGNCQPKDSAPNAVAMRALLPANTSHYITYEGSLTTPLCNEIVRFLLMRDGINASQAELDAIKVTMNARPVQYNEKPVTFRP